MKTRKRNFVKSYTLSEKRKEALSMYFEENNMNRDQAYMRFVESIGLFGNSYFGFYSTQYEKAIMTQAWRYLCFLQLKSDKSLSKWRKKQLINLLTVSK